MNLHRHPLSAIVLASAAAAALAWPTTAAAAVYDIDWLQYAPTAFSTSAPPAGLYAAPGVGPVNLSYTPVNGFSTARVATPSLSNQSVIYGGDTYQWTAHEVFGRTYLTQGPANGINQSWSISYTFSNPLPANGQLVLGVMGLGARLPGPGEAPGGLATIATVFAAPTDYTQLGEYTPSIWNPTLITTLTGPDRFTMQNQFPGIGGQDPHWNTGLALTRFDAPLAGNTLTVVFDQTLGDGIGVNIGLVRPVPEPGTWGLLTAGLLGIAGLARRRSSAST